MNEITPFKSALAVGVGTAIGAGLTTFIIALLKNKKENNA